MNDFLGSKEDDHLPGPPPSLTDRAWDVAGIVVAAGLILFGLWLVGKVF